MNATSIVNKLLEADPDEFDPEEYAQGAPEYIRAKQREVEQWLAGAGYQKANQTRQDLEDWGPDVVTYTKWVRDGTIQLTRTFNGCMGASRADPVWAVDLNLQSSHAHAGIYQSKLISFLYDFNRTVFVDKPALLVPAFKQSAAKYGSV